MSKTVFASLARIADLDERPMVLENVAQEHWQTGDYVAADVTGEPTDLYKIEDTTGEMVPVEAGDRVIGALGHRAATLEGVGSWTNVVDGRMHCLTNAGLLGAFTSLSTFLPRPISLDYVGHLMGSTGKLCMREFALHCEEVRFDIPTILLVGTSMSAGKTSTGKLIVELLSQHGQNVIGAKLTGAGRYRDILSYKQTGATEILDSVDVGLPSTVVPEDEFRAAVRPLLGYIGERSPDFLVAEAGASPLEPYNGDVAIDELGDSIRCSVLCASDPYAVLGVQKAFGLKPDIVSGPATTTSAGRDLVKKLTGVDAFNILDPDSLPGFKTALGNRLGLKLD